ncbi:TNF receptor-associated factor 2-like isoform X1 [Branchiostoma floridae x Branchiostoma japonicum]
MPGFSVILKEAGTDPKYCCSSCGKLLDEPRQTECGHRYCRTCLEDLTRTGEGKCTAHKCGETIKPGDQVFPDKAIEREIEVIPVVCNNVKDGCEWEGVVKQVKDHLSQCDYERLPCIHEAQGCQKSIQRKDLATHLQEECAFRTDACQWCKSSFPHNRMKEHQKSCPSAPAKCDWCGKKGLTRAQLEEHQKTETGSCPNMKIPCNFTPAGCKERMEKKHLHEHQKKSTNVHLNMLLALVLQLASNFEQHRDQEVESRESMRLHLPQLQKAIQDLESKLVQMERKIASDQSEGATASGSSSVKALENRIEQVRGKLEEVVKKLAAWEPRVGTFEGIVAVLNREIEKCSSQMEAYERQRRQDREIIETLERKVRSLERIIALKDVALAEQDLRIQTLELTSYDGILTWKIADFTRKRHDAITGKTASFYSPCFFTSRTGYKMCARIYLNGDGMGKGTHVSLFFVVMRGHYDGLLRWPFRQKVTFMLLDQNNREHVIDAFRPDPTSSSFQRPTSDMNIASGCPLFVPLSQLDSSSHAYVRDDTMFIRIIVDTADIN